MGFDLDWQSVGIGYGAGLLTGYTLYKSRHVLGAVRNKFSSQVDSAQSLASMGGDRRYVNELTKYALNNHLFQNAIELSEILIEPRFIPDKELSLSIEEDEALRKPFDVVPLIPDFPYLHQPYNIPNISIHDLGFGERAIALLGLPGSGKTTALMAIALWSMGKIDFNKLEDPVETRLKQQESEWSRQERDERNKTRVAIEQRAREQLREETGADITDIGQSAFTPPFRKMAPIYVHLANVILDRNTWRGNTDPAEPLVRAIQYQTGNITSKTVPGKIYRFLNEGACLLLLDGLAELPYSEQQQKMAWLHAFLDEYNNNFIIVTNTPNGYGMLQEIGFTPVHLRPWSYQDSKLFVKQMSQNWNIIIDQKNATIDEEKQDAILNDIWGLNPFEISLKVRSQLSKDQHDLEYDDYKVWTHEYIAGLFDDATDAIPIMAEAAQLQLDHHFFTLNDWLEIEVKKALSQPSEIIPGTTANEAVSDKPDEIIDDETHTFADDFEDELNQPLDSIQDETDYSFVEEESTEREDQEVPDAVIEAVDSSEEDRKNETKEARQIRRTITKLLSTMIKTGLVSQFNGNRYRFNQFHIASYLASRLLIEADENTLLEKATKSNWSQAIAYISSEIDIQNIVEAKLSHSKDIMYSNVLDVVNWLRYSDELVEWRNKYLNYLGQMFIAPSQYKTNRERIAAALVTTRDPVISKIFGRATQNPDPSVRKLAILSLGTLQDASMVNRLSAFFTDTSDDVKVATALAIGNIHTEEADTTLSSELFETSSERVQQCITEIFSDKPEIGYEILWELLNDDTYKDQLRIRRAAIFGIRRVNTDWSTVELYRTFLNEQQWYVKSTAQAAFSERLSQRNKGAKAYPQIIALPWLQEWSLNLEDESLAEASGTELLNMAMRETNSDIRKLATITSGQLGIYENIPDLYQLLNDPEDHIRDNAYRALGELQTKMGKTLPPIN